MSDTNINSRIAKNTILLYIRMLIVTIISLYTVRLTLQILGADNYGIYTAVCGIVGFLAFISATWANSAQRFLSFDLGQNNPENFNKTFNLLLSVYLILGIVIIIITESIGPWIINNKLIIPQEKLVAAHWIFQISIFSILVRFITIPYTAAIIANEKMGVYAYISIIEVILKLLIVYLLLVSTYDKLITYAVLHLFMDVTISLLYIIVCRVKFSNCNIKLYWNKTRVKELISFIGWNTLGAFSGVVEIQGMTILTNMFFPPSVVASRAIADRVNNVSYSFVANFVLSSSPQMVKYYSCGDIANFNRLFYRTSYISFYLMILISAPLILLMPELLKIWLSDSMLTDMILFSRLALISSIVSSLETPISRAISATGNVKLYEIINSTVSVLGIPIAYYLFLRGCPAFYGYVVYIIILFLSILYRVCFLRKYTSVSLRTYFTSVISPALLSVILIYGINHLIRNILSPYNLVTVVIAGMLSILSALVIIYILLPASDKLSICSFIKRKIKFIV